MGNQRKGFSLLELLVTIMVVALLTAIAIPALRTVFKQSREAQTVNNIRATASDFHLYASDNDGVAPNVGIPGMDSTSNWYMEMDQPGEMMSMYLAIGGSWPLFLYTYFEEAHRFWHPPPGPRLPDTLVEAGHTPEDYGEQRMLAMPSEFRYSQNFVTSPTLWNGEYSNLTMKESLAFAARVRLDQAAHPAAKGILVHREPLMNQAAAATAFVDGSAAMIDFEGFLPAVPYPLGDGRDPYHPVLATLDGYEGRDVSR